MKESTNDRVRVGIAVLIYNADGYLFLLERACDPCRGTWCPPIGRREVGETLRGAAEREAYEEAGAAIPLDRLRYAGFTETRDALAGLDWITHFFRIDDWRGDAYNREPEKHHCGMWVNPLKAPLRYVGEPLPPPSSAPSRVSRVVSRRERRECRARASVTKRLPPPFSGTMRIGPLPQAGRCMLPLAEKPLRQRIVYSRGAVLSVDTPHPNYAEHLPHWQKCRDVVNGEYAVKKAGRKYLPQLQGMDATDYESYKLRACFYGASERTVKGCTGAIMRKPPTQTVPDQLKDEWMPIAGIGDESFDMVTKAVLDEVLTTGRVGILVDAAAGGDEDVLPYLAIYYAENIVNWRTAMIAGEQQLILVVLKETYLVEGLSGPNAAGPSIAAATPNASDMKDEFTAENKTRYRVLRLEGFNTDNPVYTQQTYVESITVDGHKAEIVRWVPEADPVAPAMRGGRKLDFVPFAFASPQNTSPSIDKGPILDLVEVNLSHYRTSADLEHGRHFTALPMAYAAGFDIKGDIIKVGSAVVLVSGDPAARCGYMEFSGAGLQSLERALDEKEKKMAQLGGRLLESQPDARETLGAVQLRQSGEHSVLVSLAIGVSETLTKTLRWVATWMGLPADDIEFELSQEFDNMPMDPQRLTALMQAFLAGKISFQTWFYNLQRGDVYPDGWTEEDEKDAISAEAPPPPPVQGAGGNGDRPNQGTGKGATGNQGEAAGGSGGPVARPVPALSDRAGGGFVTGV